MVCFGEPILCFELKIVGVEKYAINNTINEIDLVMQTLDIFLDGVYKLRLIFLNGSTNLSKVRPAIFNNGR